MHPWGEESRAVLGPAPWQGARVCKAARAQGVQKQAQALRGLARGPGYSLFVRCKRFSLGRANSSLIKGTDLSLPRLSWYMHGLCYTEAGEGTTEGCKTTSADVFKIKSFTSSIRFGQLQYCELSALSFPGAQEAVL